MEGIAVELGFGESKTKEAVAWVGEKIGRLKLNGQLRGYSPLSRVLELEALAVGVSGSWRFGSHCLRCREDYRLRAAREAFSPEPGN